MIFFNDIQEDPARSITRTSINADESSIITTSPLLPNTERDYSSNITSVDLIAIQNISKHKAQAREKEVKQPIPFKLIFTVVYQVLFGGITYGCSLIPESSVLDSEVYIEWSSYVYYMLMVISGFCYVTIITCNRGRDFLKDRSGSHKVRFMPFGTIITNLYHSLLYCSRLLRPSYTLQHLIALWLQEGFLIHIQLPSQ